MKKNYYQIEKVFKGVANHNRIKILHLIYKNQGITVDGISESLGLSFKNTSAHLQKLVNAGLVNKKYLGRQVTHSLSPYGQKIIKFVITF